MRDWAVVAIWLAVGCGDAAVDPAGVYRGDVTEQGNGGTLLEDADDEGIADGQLAQFDRRREGVEVRVRRIDDRHVTLEVWDGCRLRAVGRLDEERPRVRVEAGQRCRVTDDSFDGDVRVGGTARFDEREGQTSLDVALSTNERVSGAKAGQQWLRWSWRFRGRRAGEGVAR